jgi:CPA2 family monovalent cation:H+ antiporter-2
MAKMGMDNGLISPQLYNLVLASALISIILTPGFMRSSNYWYTRLRRVRLLLRFMPEQEMDERVAGKEMKSHIILLGCGRMGRNVADGIQRLNLPLVVLDYDYTSIQYLTDRNINCIYGDASNPLVLALSHPERACMAVLTLPDAYHSREAILHLHKLNPKLIILARAHNRWYKDMLLEVGATAVVQPEAEAGFQIVRQIILNMELPDDTVKNYLNSMYHADYDRILRERGLEPAPKEQLRAEEFILEAGSPLIGCTLRKSGIRENTGCNIAAITRQNGNIIVNPQSNEKFDEGDILIAMGKAIELGKLRMLINAE